MDSTRCESQTVQAFVEAVREGREPPALDSLMGNGSSAPLGGDLDYPYFLWMVYVLSQAPPSEKPRFLKIILKYLLTYL